VLSANPQAPSGTYVIDVDGVTTQVECDMQTDGGGWGLLLRFNEGDACPGQWRAAARGCRRVQDADASAMTVDPPYAFTEIRGEVNALGYGGSDAFRDGANDIDANYVDGLGITIGSPRRHVFTFAHGVSEAFGDMGAAACPCDSGTAAHAFIGSNYLCEEPQESADPANTGTRYYDEDDVMFDGLDIEDAACVGAPESAPDFSVDLGQVSADTVELRLMGTEGTGNEDTAVIFLELWVR